MDMRELGGPLTLPFVGGRGRPVLCEMVPGRLLRTVPTIPQISLHGTRRIVEITHSPKAHQLRAHKRA